jgi:dTDP-4-amino-4,6-dideoxygalactose transaminase
MMNLMLDASLRPPAQAGDMPAAATRPAPRRHVAKARASDLAVFGGPALFDPVISTSNLVQPDIEVFLRYSRRFYAEHRFTNDGPLVRELEQRLARFHGARHCIATSNGFWALVMAMRCLALPGRSEVVMPSLTYRRLADIAAWVGLTPHFCEVDADSLAISPTAAAACINERTALLLAVHPIVNCCDAVALEAVAREHGVPLLFDSVESVYETVAGRKVGSFGGAECFSMHASKLVNGFEGGYITTNDSDLARRLALMRGFGFDGPDRIEGLGINAKLNEVHAAMALAGLDDLEAQVLRNRARYLAYQRELAGLDGLRLLEFDESQRTSYKTVVVELTDAWPLSREQTLAVLNLEGALARAYYAPPLHQKRCDYPVIAPALPVTDRLSQRFMLLPCGHQVTHADITAVARLLRFVAREADTIRSRLS